MHIHLSNVNHPLAQRISDSSIESYKVDSNTTGYILELSDNDRENIVKPFIEGKYSQIDREYVKTNFPEKEFIGFDVFGKAQYKKLINYKILTKSKELHNWWEERLGCPLPPDAEVWSIPDLKQEVYLYEENSGTRPEPPTVNRLENTGNNTESVQES
ncbi:MAG: hypothetical protein KBB16_03340 [Candidatus Pacebacteria bacterium]|nr:hypothetical protein [Candidatus Paceibacterota bacterium]